MSEHYCSYKDGMCELDVDEAYQQGRADRLDSIIQAMKDKYYCVEDLCGESIDCSECVVRYLELLKEQMNDGTNDK